MITHEERGKLKVGDVVYTVDDTVMCARCVMSGEVIDNETVDFTFFTRSLYNKRMFIKKIDAYRTARKMMSDDINYLNEEIEFIDVLIKQLEQENGN